jgi:hypothetical protein
VEYFKVFLPNVLVFTAAINMLGMHSTFCQANIACLSKLFRVAVPTSSRPSHPISFSLPFFVTSKSFLSFSYPALSCIACGRVPHHWDYE